MVVSCPTEENSHLISIHLKFTSKARHRQHTEVKLLRLV